MCAGGGRVAAEGPVHSVAAVLPHLSWLAICRAPAACSGPICSGGQHDGGVHQACSNLVACSMKRGMSLRCSGCRFLIPGLFATAVNVCASFYLQAQGIMRPGRCSACACQRVVLPAAQAGLFACRCLCFVADGHHVLAHQLDLHPHAWWGCSDDAGHGWNPSLTGHCSSRAAM